LSGTATKRSDRISSIGLPDFSDMAVSSAAVRAVRIRPGAAQVTKMLSDATSADNVFAHPASAGRKAFDTIRPGIGCSTEEETMLTIRPHRAARIIGRTARVN